jgi:eukaryotic-like serine/threonine-protein kinase
LEEINGVEPFMDSQQWSLIQEVFHEAIAKRPQMLLTWLRSRCGEDEQVITQVLRMLEEDRRSVPLLDAALAIPASSVTQSTDAVLPHGAPIEVEGSVIDRYHLLQKIGEGGMGEVWLAEQKEPVRRRVALKLVKAGMNSREVIARFESERQALALMDHPAIAKVLDAGSTLQGAPYFVMEYVAGVPITTYCDNHRLNTSERLELFMHVCEGVQHAHQKAIIHRDLKPSNILVTEVDGHPAPKIIDFGVAKALTQKLTADSLFTRVGALVGTPQYMSPEQALSSGEDIDTRTDVYSLGVILYELLAGVHPIDLRKAAFEEFLRRLREDDPPKPSTKFRAQDPDTSTDLARKRHTEPPALVKQMRGDLDSIALKALEKDRSRRYGSPSDFASDIARYLKDEPVLAVPPSAAYRASKFARRYRGALVVVCAFVLVLVAASVISIHQSVRASREAASAQAVNDFLQNDLLAQASVANQSGPSAKLDPNLKVRTALDRAAQRIAGKFDQQPEVEAAVRDTIGRTYMDLGLYPEARAQLERAVELYRRSLGADHPITLITMSHLGGVAYRQGKYPEAESILNQTLEAQRRVLGPDHPDTLSSMNTLANVYLGQGKYAQAEALDSQILEIRRRVLGPEHPETLASINNLANAYDDQGKYAQAEALDGEALEIKRRIFGPEHPATLASMNNLANVYHDEGKDTQAEALHSQTLEIKRRVLGPEHPDTLESMNNLANVYETEGKYAQAEPLYSQTLEIKRRVFGSENPQTLIAMNNLSGVYSSQGKYEQAEALDRQTVEIERRVLGPEHPWTLTTTSNLADDYGAEAKYEQAEALYSQTLEIRRRVLGPEHPETLIALSNFASLYQRQGKYALAESYASQTLAGRRRALGPEHPVTMEAADDLALAYLSQGKFTESEPLAREAMQTDRKNQPDDWQCYRAESLLGASLAGQKRYAEAEPLLLEGYQGMLARKQTMTVEDRLNLNLAHEWLVQLYRAWSKPQKAAEWKKK